MKKDISIWLIIFFLLIFIFKIIILLLTFTWKYSITNEFQTLDFHTVFIMMIKFLKNDLFVFSTFFLIIYLSNITHKKYLRRFLKLFLGILVSYYLFDTLLIYFSTRLFIIDIPKFIIDIPDKRILFYWIWFFSWFGLIYIICSKIKFFIKNHILLYVSIISTILSIIPLHISANYIKEWLFSKNIYQLNLDLWYMKKYSNTNQLKNEYTNLIQTEKWLWNKKNVILLTVESLSAIDSLKTWWLKDYMPRFDKIQSEWTSFTNFYASANTTDWWLINMLEWVELIPYRASSDYYSTFKPLTTTLPKFFKTLWYSTYFITTGPLEFLHKWEFLQNIWFENTIWWESFQDKPKYTFWSAPDEYLYEKSLNIINENLNSWKSFFINMLTISSHLTYNTPYWDSKQDMYKYIDEKIYQFYTQLKQTNFFDNWILIIVWDHRKMSPLEEWESEKFWLAAYWKISACIIWKWIPAWKQDNHIYQQTDIFYSIKKIIWSGNVQLLANYNNIFSWDIKRDFSIIPMFSDKNSVIAVKWNKSEIIALDWDKTKYINENLWDEIVNYLNKLRAFQMDWN